ncbi:hypothetical protein D3C78_1571140 [compost metagenome]
MLRRECTCVRLSKVNAACICSDKRVCTSNSSARNKAGTVTEPHTMKNSPHGDGSARETGSTQPMP